MSLRSRIAVLIAATVLLASAVGGVGAALSSRSVGRNQVDEQLVADVARYDQVNPGVGTQLQVTFEIRRSACDLGASDDPTDETTAAPTDDRRPTTRGERLARLVPEFASSMQLVRANGLIISGCVTLPVDETETAIATSGRGTVIRTVSIDGKRYRMITAGFGEIGAIQFARDLELTEDTLRGLFVRITLFGGIGALLAGLLGWYLAGRATRPIERLSGATDRVARTRDLGERIPIENNDEVGALASSFNTMLESLDTSREQQQRLVQDASHELRTPLTSMRTNVELLQRHSDIPEDLREQVLEDIGAELAELTELTAELVESATEVRTDVDRSAPFDLREVVEGCVERGRRRHRREITLVATPHEESMVMGDGALVARAVTNLINNAAKFSANGDIDVVTHGTTVRVLDRGPGIPEADLPHVFDRFYRATAARSAPGSGLGLAIVKQIVEVHGGSLHATNRTEGGLEIGFSLPVAGATGGAAAPLDPV